MNNGNQFSIRELMKTAWHNVEGTKWLIWAPLVALILIGIGISLIFSLFGLPVLYAGFTTGYTISYVIMAFIMEVITIFVTAPLVAGAQMVALKRVRGETLAPNMGFKYWSMWLNLGLTLIIVTLGIGVINVVFGTLISLGLLVGYWLGLILQILALIAFIVFYAFFIFAILFVADRNEGPIEALIACYKMVKPHWLHVSIVIFCLGAALLIVFLPLLLLSLTGHFLLSLLGTIITTALAIWAFPFFHLVVSGTFHKLAD